MARDETGAARVERLPRFVYCPCGRFGIPANEAHWPGWHDGCGPTAQSEERT